MGGFVDLLLRLHLGSGLGGVIQLRQDDGPVLYATDPSMPLDDPILDRIEIGVSATGGWTTEASVLDWFDPQLSLSSMTP